ncbi:hypothetical protein [Halobellus limi]|jgi:hypothetical protein|uniref:Uncharacterized protein n=1 Tax=Halobellus limi TaxID=699433 RepID=A0A1H5TC78_9EURY|nr:hypothetical protein [Halobellus limi]QCC47348.1 hypothetical protein DV707_06560 [Halobellus limi]SEF60360.1 hypothetical protein SAMN04488133_0236 [Halobellus limi]
MVLRAVALVFGIVELIAPRRLVDFWMGLATTDDVELRPWVYTAARAEGVVLVLWALKGGCSGDDEPSP